MSDQRVTSQREIGVTDTDPSPALDLFRAPLVLRYLAAFLMTALATVVAVAVDSHVTIPNLSLVFVIPVIVAAVAFGFGASFFAAILGALAYNFFLTEPRYTLNVDDPANIWAIALLFVVGCIVSPVASIARRRADDAARLRQQAAILRSYSRDILAAGDTKAVIVNTANALEALFQVPVAVITLSGAAVDLVERRGNLELLAAELEAGQSTLTTGKALPAGLYPFDSSRFDFWPVTTATGQQAIIGLAFDPDERPLKPGVLVETVGSILALALDRRPLKT